MKSNNNKYTVVTIVTHEGGVFTFSNPKIIHVREDKEIVVSRIYDKKLIKKK